MNKLRILILAAMAAGMLPLLAQSAPQPATGAVKLGFINLERALAEVQEGKVLFGDLQTFIDKKNSELESQRNDIQKRQDQLRAQERTLSEESKIDIQKDLEERRTRLTRFQEDTSKEIERRQNLNIQKIGQKMQPLIQAFAKERGYTAIVVWSPQLYAYVDENVNITDEIIKRYDTANPAAAPAAPPAKKP